MASKSFVELNEIDQTTIEISKNEIRRYIPQRFEFEQLDGIFKVYRDEKIIVGYRDVRNDEFWVRGHIPGMPLLPGVLMIEAAAQLCAVYQNLVLPVDGFLGFGGIDGVKFRAAVHPGERLILLGKAVQVSRRISFFDAQAVVGEKIVFEGRICGVAIAYRGRSST